MPEIEIYHDAPLEQYQELVEQARVFAETAKAPNTRRAYRAAWQDFLTWCESQGKNALPAEVDTLMLYLVARSQTLKPATLEARLAAIKHHHTLAGLSIDTDHPALREILKGIRRAKGTAPTQKSAATVDVVRALVSTLKDDLLGMRDRALLLLGFAGAFRRSELVGLDVADIENDPEGLVITIRRSKTDQEGEGRVVGIPHGLAQDTCPVRALQGWLRAAGIGEGPIFRPVDRHGNVKPVRLTGHAVAKVVKRCAKAAGLDEAQFAGHSLRSGFATTAARAGASDREIMDQTGHKTKQALDRYIRRGNLFKNNAAGKVGL